MKRSTRRHTQYKSISSSHRVATIAAIILAIGGAFYAVAAGPKYGDVLERPESTRGGYLVFTATALKAATTLMERGLVDKHPLTSLERMEVAGIVQVIMSGPEVMSYHVSMNDLGACEDLVEGINGALYELRDMMAKRAAILGK